MKAKELFSLHFAISIT